jgi:hypothetical protein
MLAFRNDPFSPSGTDGSNPLSSSGESPANLSRWCYGSPADDHVIQPKDAGIMVEIVNAVSTGVRRPIQFFHLPVPKPRTDDAYFAPLAGLKLRPETELYLGLAH